MQTQVYNRYSRYLHWIMAGLLVFMILMGWRFEERDTLRADRAALHKSIGIAILFFTFLRVALRLAYKAPPPIEGPKWQMMSAKIVHIGFYVLMIALPMSGWAMVSTSAREIILFKFIHWPHLPVAQSKDLHELFENVHGIQAKILTYVLIPLHVLAALKHHFVDKDLTMSQMVSGLTPKPLFNWRWLVPILVMASALIAGNLLMKGTPLPKEGEQPQATQGTAISSASSAVNNEEHDHDHDHDHDDAKKKVMSPS